jgi:hypothetical protein
MSRIFCFVSSVSWPAGVRTNPKASASSLHCRRRLTSFATASVLTLVVNGALAQLA